jgi:hypothetical protein
LNGKSSWLEYSHQIQNRSLDAVCLKLGTSTQLRTKILSILSCAHNDGILANKINEIHALLKLTLKSNDLMEITGGSRNFKRRREIPHFSRCDDCWFDFSILVREERKHSEIIGFDFEMRFPERMTVPFIRFDLNLPDHDNQADGLRFHVHPGNDDFQIHSPAMNPLEILHLFLYGLEIPEKIRRA